MERCTLINGGVIVMTKVEPKVVYTNGHWTVELRSRTNHPGLKSWGLYGGHEIFSYDERGLRTRDGGWRVVIPTNVLFAAHNAWHKSNSGKADFDC